MIPRSIQWCSSQAFCRSPNNSTFVEGSSKLCQCTKNLRLEDCGTQTLSFQVGFRGVAQVSTCSETHCHLLRTLENALLGFGSCLAQVSLCFLKQNSDPTLDSLGRTKHVECAESVKKTNSSPLVRECVCSALLERTKLEGEVVEGLGVVEVEVEVGSRYLLQVSL